MAQIIGQRWEVYPFADVSGSVPQEGELVCICHPNWPDSVISLIGNSSSAVVELYDRWLATQHPVVGVVPPANGNAAMALSLANGAENIDLPNSAGGTDAQRRAGLMSGQDKQRLDAIQNAAFTAIGAQSNEASARRIPFNRENGGAAENLDLPVATGAEHGLMSSEDKQRLDGISGAISTYVPPPTASARGGIRVTEDNGLSLSDGDRLALALSTPGSAGAMSAADKQRVDNAQQWVASFAQMNLDSAADWNDLLNFLRNNPRWAGARLEVPANSGLHSLLPASGLGWLFAERMPEGRFSLCFVSRPDTASSKWFRQSVNASANPLQGNWLEDASHLVNSASVKYVRGFEQIGFNALPSNQRNWSGFFRLLNETSTGSAPAMSFVDNYAGWIYPNIRSQLPLEAGTLVISMRGWTGGPATFYMAFYGERNRVFRAANITQSDVSPSGNTPRPIWIEETLSFQNTIFGNDAGRIRAGLQPLHNVILGSQAARAAALTKMQENVIIGHCAGRIKPASMEGFEQREILERSVIIGASAMQDGAAARSTPEAEQEPGVIAIGANAGMRLRGNSVYVGNNIRGDRRPNVEDDPHIKNADRCTFIGHQQSVLANRANCTALGFGAAARLSGDNQLQLGGTNVRAHSEGPVLHRSDARDKADIKDSEFGLEFIERLRPRDYRYNYRYDYLGRFDKETGEPLTIDPASEKFKRKRFHHGFIAQEVKEAFAGLGHDDFGGYIDENVNGGDDVLLLGYEEFIAPMVKAMQQLSGKIKELEERLKVYEQSN